MVVYCVQEPISKRPDGTWKRSLNLRPAEAFGELRFVLPRGRGSTGMLADLDEIVDELRLGLADFRTDDDYLLPTGSPILISAAGAIVAELTGGRVPMLAWLGHTGEIGDPEVIRSAFIAIANRNRATLNDLLIYGRIIKNELGEEGWPIWRDVTQAALRIGSRKVWDGLDAIGDLATLLRDARRAGWRDPTGGYVAIEVDLGRLPPVGFDRNAFEDFSRS